MVMEANNNAIAKIIMIATTTWTRRFNKTKKWREKKIIRSNVYMTFYIIWNLSNVGTIISGFVFFFFYFFFGLVFVLFILYGECLIFFFSLGVCVCLCILFKLIPISWTSFNFRYIVVIIVWYLNGIRAVIFLLSRNIYFICMKNTSDYIH